MNMPTGLGDDFWKGVGVTVGVVFALVLLGMILGAGRHK
jgi:hypothetical protein